MNNIQKYHKILFECVIDNVSALRFSNDFFRDLADVSGISEDKIVLLFPGGIKEFISELEKFYDYLLRTPENQMRIRDRTIIERNVFLAITKGKSPAVSGIWQATASRYPNT